MLWFRVFAAGLLVCSLAAAQPSDPKQRTCAVRELARQGPDSIPKLDPYLADPVAAVRAEAVKALVEIDTGASLDPLVKATRDNDPEVQIRATDGLVNFYLPGYVKSGLSASLDRMGNVFKARFTDTNDQVIDSYVNVRPEIIAALGKLAGGASSMEARANAARALGILRGKAALPELTAALRSKDDRLMYESLIALQKIRDPEAGPSVALLVRDFDEKIQTAAIETTGLLRYREALPQLRSVLENASSSRVRRAALTAIAMLPDEASRPLYEKYLNDKDDWMRAAASEGLGRLKSASDLPVLEKSWKGEEKKRAQLADAFALVLAGKTEMAPLSPMQFLVDTLNSASWKGVASAYLIEAAREPSVRAPLQQATRTATRDEKIELAQILALSGDQATLPVLDALSHDPDTEVAQAALNATRTLKNRLQ